MASDDHVLTTIRFIPQHEVVQKYSAILLDNFTNQSMKESKAYKTYYSFTTGKEIPKPKYVRRSIKEKTKQEPKACSGKRIKSTAKVTRSGKKKQITEGLETLSKIALSEAEQMKLAIERSKTQLYSSQPNGSDDDDKTSVSKDKDDDDQEDDDQDNDDDQGDDDKWTDSDNDGADFVHPKFSTHDEEDSFDPRVQAPSHVGSTDDEECDEEIQGVHVEGDKLDEDETNKGDEGDELYRDSSFVSSGFISNMLNPSPDTVPAPAIVPSSYLQDLPNFGFLFGYDHRLKALEDNFLEFKQTNQFAKAVASIPGIVDTESKTSHVVAANLSKPELKRIPIDKIERNKSIHRSDEQKNLYKALDEDEGPSAGSNQGSKRRRARKEPESTSAPKEKTFKSVGKSKEGSKSHQEHPGNSTQAEEPIHADKELEQPAHQEFDTGFTEEKPVDGITQHHQLV
nr:hypothetical protein [Tanacetum cinerariifolium]